MIVVVLDDIFKPAPTDTPLKSRMVPVFWANTPSPTPRLLAFVISPPPPPPVDAMVTAPLDADVMVTLEPAIIYDVPSTSCVSEPLRPRAALK